MIDISTYLNRITSEAQKQAKVYGACESEIRAVHRPVRTVGGYRQIIRPRHSLGSTA